MPRKKSEPVRDKRLTTLLSEKEMSRVQRMIKKMPEVANLSELVRLVLDEKAATVLARQPRQPKAAIAIVADAPKKRGRPRKIRPEVETAAAVAMPKKRGRKPKSVNGVAAATA